MSKDNDAIIDELVSHGPVLTDGGWGTELQARGLKTAELPDLWNLAHPERVEEVARAYVDAGSRVVLTNTFRANRVVLAARGAGDQVEAINRAGVAISKRAAGDRARVFASIGPSGRMLFAGDIAAAELEAAFSEQARALASAGADALVIETMADLDEARIAVAAAVSTGLPVVACMVFDSGRDKNRTMTGVTPGDAAAGLVAAGANAVGANCGLAIGAYLPICTALASATDRPVWVKPNAGLPTIVDGRAVYQVSAEQFASQAPALLAAGARFLGGCCGTNPEFIAALDRRLDASKESK